MLGTVFIENIRARMDAKGIKPPELATTSGLSISNLNRWLRGEGLPSVPNIEALAQALGCESWELIKPIKASAPIPREAPKPAAIFAALAALGDARLQAIARMNESDWAAVDFILANAGEQLPAAQTDDTEDKPAGRKHRA